MKPLLPFVCGAVLCAFGSGAHAGEAPYYRDLFPDTWVAHDALGRNMPTCSVVGPVKKDHRRVVGISISRGTAIRSTASRARMPRM